MKGKKLVIAICVVTMISAVVGLAACAPKANKTIVGNPTPNVKQSDITPEPDKYGVVKAVQWAEAYPYEYQTYLENAYNTPVVGEYPTSEYMAQGGTAEDTTSTLPSDFTGDKVTQALASSNKMDYLQTNPEIKTLGLGYGYAKYYTEPASHVYSLWTVTHNGRVANGNNTKAACITCKSPQYSNLVDMEGESVHMRPFNEVVGQLDENVSCASCHGNTPMVDGEVYLEVDRAMWTVAMGEDANKASLEGQVCGQCHCDYSMAPGTSIPTSPYYGGTASMVPDLALQWYDEHNYVDWTYASTGAKMLAVRHAEYEFNYGGEGSHMQRLGYDCNDCHMATTTAADGTVYASHNWISPLDNQELIDRDCSKCHANLRAEVAAIQSEIMQIEQNAGYRAVSFIHNFENALNAGTLNDEQISRLQYIQRAACYYWNLASAENSEGAHNSDLSRECIAKTHALLDEGDRIIGVKSTAEAGM